MTDYIVIAVVAAVIGAAVRYIVKAKKRGKKCVGCSGSCSCFGKESCCGEQKK